MRTSVCKNKGRKFMTTRFISQTALEKQIEKENIAREQRVSSELLYRQDTMLQQQPGRKTRRQERKKFRESMAYYFTRQHAAKLFPWTFDGSLAHFSVEDIRRIIRDAKPVYFKNAVIRFAVGCGLLFAAVPPATLIGLTYLVAGEHCLQQEAPFCSSAGEILGAMSAYVLVFYIGWNMLLGAPVCLSMQTFNKAWAQFCRVLDYLFYCFAAKPEMVLKDIEKQNGKNWMYPGKSDYFLEVDSQRGTWVGWLD